MPMHSGCSQLSDDELLAAFESLQLAPASFHHADHVRLAWIYIHRFGAVAAERRLLEGIGKLAVHSGKPSKFLYTTTVAWARLVAARVDQDSAKLPFEAWVLRHPELLNKDLLDQFYSANILESDAARAHWIEPDRKALCG